MEHVEHIPLFPLRILPLPGELVPLHIFEPRYKQLLQEVEANDIRFGIYFDHPMNDAQVGSVMRLETVVKRYPKGELDVIVKCEDTFTLDVLRPHYPGKLYPGGTVQIWNQDLMIFPDQDLYQQYQKFRVMRGVATQTRVCSIFEIANELNLDFADRYRFVTLRERRRNFLFQKIDYHLKLLEHEARSKDVFHLN